MERFSDTLESPRNVKVIDDIKTFEQEVADAIRKWHETTQKQNFYVAFDGLPGAGKTTLMERLKNICQRAGIILHENGVDNFITTDRDDPLRRTMTRDTAVFQQRYYSRASVRRLLKEIEKVNGQEKVIQFDELYDRSTGKVGEGSIKVPSGRKVVLLEGVNSIPLIREMEEKHDAIGLKVHVYAKPHEAMKRAITRDTRNGSRKADEAYQLRAAEYAHLIQPINERNPHMANIIYLH